MFFLVQHTEENVVEFTRKLDDLDLDICWLTHPYLPVLVTKLRQLSDPFTLQRYRESFVEVDNTVSSVNPIAEECWLTSEAQVMRFLEVAFFVDPPPIIGELYEYKELSMQEIFDVVTRFTSIYDYRSVLAFTRRCANSSLPLMTANMIRVGNTRKRQLYCLKEEYQVQLVRLMTGQL